MTREELLAKIRALDAKAEQNPRRFGPAQRRQTQLDLIKAWDLEREETFQRVVEQRNALLRAVRVECTCRLIEKCDRCEAIEKVCLLGRQEV